MTLSDKERFAKTYHRNHVKEFIEELKEAIYEDDLLGWRNKKVLKHYSEMIDRLAGDKLTSQNDSNCGSRRLSELLSSGLVEIKRQACEAK